MRIDRHQLPLALLRYPIHAAAGVEAGRRIARFADKVLLERMGAKPDDFM